MFALIIVPMALFWAADNQAFLANVTDARWDYVGRQERTAGPRPDGSVAAPVATDTGGYILFKQRPKHPEAPVSPDAPRDLAEN